MLQVRKANERGHANHGWLNAWHSFSFAEYYDPDNMGFGPLRVINDDTIAAGAGFPTHGHRDMEIITYVLDGAIAHKDSMGNGSEIRNGDVQRMSAGSGVRHSEFNPSATEKTRMLQIWIEPDTYGSAPGYEEKVFGNEEKRGRLRLIASKDAADGSVRIQQDARLYAGLFDGTERAELALDPQRLAYVHLARGKLRVNGVALEGGDGVRLAAETKLELDQGEQAEVLVFDLPK